MVTKRGKQTTTVVRTRRPIPFDRILFYGIAFVVFSLPIFIWPGISEYGYGKTIVALIAVSVLSVLWGLDAWQKKTWTLRLPWVTLPVVGLVVASLFSLLHATNGRFVVQSLILVVFFTWLMILIANAVRERRDITVLLFALLASGFLAALYGLLQYLGVMRGPIGTGGLNDVISTMGNRNYLGGFLSYLFFPAIVLVVRPRSRWLRLLSILLIAFCFGMILIVSQAGTSVALVLSAAALLVGIAIFRPIEPIRRNRTWLLVLIGVLIVTFLIESPSGPLNSVVGFSADDAELGTANLLLNPGFEAGSAFWGTNGQLQDTNGHDSQAWWRIERAGVNRGDWQLVDNGRKRYIPIEPGASYEFGGAILSNGRTTALIRVHLYDAEKTTLSWFNAGREAPESWRQVKTLFTAPRDVHYASIQLIAANADGWAGFDGLFLRPVGHLEAWIRRLWDQNAGKVRSWDWWVGWEMFADHPLTGAGLGNYKLDFLPYKAEFLASPRGETYDFYIERAAQAHNEYVQILAELGVLGVLALASFLVVLSVSLWKRLRSSGETERFDLLLFACGIVAFLAHSVVGFPAHLPSSTLVLVLVGGIVFSRVYGDSAQSTVRLSGWTLKSMFVAVAVIGAAISTLATRDLQANLLMNEGIQQAQLGNNRAAEALFERSLKLDFAPHQTYYHLAVVQIERAEYDEAQVNLERCLTRFLDETVYLNYANLTANARQFDRTREIVSFLLSTHPQPEIAVRARYLEAIVVAQTGDAREATALLEALIADAPAFEPAYIGLGTVFEARGMPVNARQTFSEALRIIEGKLDKAKASLAGRSTITVEEYGSLRSEIEQLEQERDTVLDKLEGLPPA